MLDLILELFGLSGGEASAAGDGDELAPFIPPNG